MTFFADFFTPKIPTFRRFTNRIPVKAYGTNMTIAGEDDLKTTRLKV